MRCFLSRAEQKRQRKAAKRLTDTAKGGTEATPFAPQTHCQR